MTIRRKYGLIVVLFALASAAPVVAQNQWEGTAVVGRYGEFPPGGLYAASNTFPLNTLVSVTNTRNGRTARLIVVREIDDPGIFLLLSESAAYDLGITSGSTASVRVSPVQLPGLTSVSPNQDLPFHPDPDVNPAASLGDPNASIIRPSAVIPEPARPDIGVERPSVDERDFAGNGGVTADTPTIAGSLTAEFDEPDVSLPRVNPTATAEIAVALAVPSDPAPMEVDKLERDPFDERISVVERTLATERVSQAPLGTPLETRVVDKAEVPDAVETPDTADGPLEGDEEQTRPSKIPDDVIVSLEPADYRPPEAPPKPQPVQQPLPAPKVQPEKVQPEKVQPEPEEDDRIWAKKNLPLITDLRSGSSYVQVAAFSNPRSVKAMVDELGERFPVAVLPLPQGEENRSVYRLYVGPLAEDEKGSALYTVRGRGFRDAFVKNQP